MDETTLFLDQSTKLVGWSIFTNDKLISHGSYDLSKINSGKDIVAHTEKRIHLIDKLCELITKYNIAHVVYEDIFSTPNAITFKLLAKVQGSLEDMSLRKGITFEPILATTWRSYLPLIWEKKGRHDRKEVKSVVTSYFKSIFPNLADSTTEDEKEAILIGIAWTKNRSKTIL